MPVDPALLARRWPERRSVVLAGAAIGFAAVATLVQFSRDPALGMLYVAPVLLLALELGTAGGLVAAAFATILVVAGGAIVPAVPAVVVAAIAGRFSGRMRGLHEREQRLLESAMALGELGAHDRVPEAVAVAALRTPGATGVEVVLDGFPRAALGRRRGDFLTTGILVRGEQLGSIELSHDRPLAREDCLALELLAVEAGLAADNHRLLVQEREAAAMQAELRHIRDDLLEQRAGLGQLLDAQEDERRRHAETLHEDLAQVLAGVLMRLRAGHADDSLDGLHSEVRGVLADLRDVATALRPSSLAQLGLLPALEAIDGLAVEAEDIPDPLPEPLRTGLYRMLEHVRSAADGEVRVRLQGHDGALDVSIDGEFPAPESVAAARARVALLEGTLDIQAQSEGRIRLSARLPMRHALHV